MIGQQLGPNQKLWLEALRSGEYTQTTEVLHNLETGGVCCLGVAAILFKTKETRVQDGLCEERSHKEKVRWYDFEQAVAPPYVVRNLSLRSQSGVPVCITHTCLTDMNDEGKTFEEIADIVQANPFQYFIEPK